MILDKSDILKSNFEIGPDVETNTNNFGATLGWDTIYECRDKVTDKLSRKPYPRSVFLLGHPFVRNGPSRIIKYVEGHERHRGLLRRGMMTEYFDGNGKLSRTHKWQHPRLNNGEFIDVEPGPAIEFSDPEMAEKYNRYFIDGVEYSKEEYFKKIEELRLGEEQDGAANP